MSTAEPKSPKWRLDTYYRQNGGGVWTNRQWRRLMHKANHQDAPFEPVSLPADRFPLAQETPTCRTYADDDGQPVLVHGAGPLDDTEQGYLREVVAAAKRRYAAEHPDQEGPTP